jgi:hypothetical protein
MTFWGCLPGSCLCGREKDGVMDLLVELWSGGGQKEEGSVAPFGEEKWRIAPIADIADFTSKSGEI